MVEDNGGQMKHLLLYAGTIILAGLFGGCAEPEMLYHANPVSENTVWYSGREFVTQTEDSITVSVAFENELDGAMTFYVVVGNYGSQCVLIAPENIYCEGSARYVKEVTDFETMAVSSDTVSETDTVYALNPETELQGIDKQAAQATATYANNTGLNVAAGLLQLVGNVATIGQNKTREELHREDRARREVAESQNNNNLNYSLQSASLADQRAYWEGAALRKTTLFQDNAIGGKVRVPVDQHARTLKLIVPIAGTTFSFEFNQRPLPLQ